VDKADDPKRPGRPMACVSCHNAHSSDWKGLFRYKAEKPADLCQHCHR
jgi:predicted CXXCH cytochrome family protein